MARYINDQNKVIGTYESGTYGVQMTGSGHFWIGEVTENSISDSEGLIENRYLGTASRSYDSYTQGPQDVTGTLSYNAQDMRLVFYSIGSIYGVSGDTGVNSVHTVTEINSNVIQNKFTSGTAQGNAPISFTLEDSKQAVGTGRNFIRTVKGIVPNTCTISATQGEKVTVALDWLGQSEVTSSGTSTTITAVTRRPYLWSDCSLSLVSSIGATSGLSTIKGFDFETNQNRTGPHYLNGSRVIATPFNGNRDYNLSVTMDLDGTEADMLYNEMYKNNAAFNFTIDMDADATAGSQHATFYLSGCKILSMENPSVVEGTTETTIEIKPKNVNGVSYDSDNLSTSSGLYHLGIDW